MKKEFSHHWVVILLSLFLMTMFICALYIPVSAANPLEGDSSSTAICPAFPDLILPDEVSSFPDEYVWVCKSGDLSILFIPLNSDFDVSYSGSHLSITDAVFWEYNPGSGFKLSSFNLMNINVATIEAVYYGSKVSMPTMSDVSFTLSSVDLEVKTVSSTGILDVFSALAVWFVSILASLLTVFYSVETGMTVLGVLACCALGVGAILMIAMFLKKFFHWR